MNMIILYITNPNSTKLIYSFQKWREKTEFIIVNDQHDPFFPDTKTYTLNELNCNMISGKTIALIDDEPDIKEKLKSVPGATDLIFISRRQWIISMLEDKNAYLEPKEIRLDICTRCQLKCVSCYMRNDKRATTGFGHVSPEQFEEFLKQNSSIPSIQRIEISNSGEPFLHPQMHEILTIAHNHQVTLTCYNGANFNTVSDQILNDLVDYGFESITVALDGVSQQSYQVYRRNGDFDRVISNIKKLNMIKQMKHSEYPKLIWQFVIMSHNYDEIPIAAQMAKDLGMKISYRDTWSPVERAKLKQLLSERQEAKPSDNISAKDSIVNNNRNSYESYCRELLISPQINWDGRLLGCCQIYRSDWGINVFKSSLKDVLNGKIYRETLLALLRGDQLPFEHVPCYTCKRRPKDIFEAERIVEI